MFQHNTGQQLPFRTDQPQLPFLSISEYNPPYTPQNLPVPPELQPYVGRIAGALAVDVQTHAHLSPMRMFTYNQLSENTYMNDAFVQLVGATVDVIYMRLMARMYGTVEEAIGQVVPLMTKLVTAVNVRTFQGLEPTVDPSMKNEIYQAVQVFDELANQILMAKRSMPMQPMAPAQPQWGQPSSQWGAAPAQPQWGQPSQQGWGQPQASFGQRQAPQWVQQQRGGPTPALYGGQQGQPHHISSPRRMGGNRWASQGTPSAAAPAPAPMMSASPVIITPQDALRQRYTPKEPAMQSNQQVTESAPVTTSAPAPVIDPPAPAEVPAAGNLSMWKPSLKYPHLPAYNPAKYELFLGVEPDGVVKPILKYRKSDVDYDQHATTGVFGPLPAKFDLKDSGEVLNRLQRGLDRLNQEVKEPPAAKTPDSPRAINTCLMKGDLRETSESAAIFVAALDRHTCDNGGTPDVYRAYGRVADPVLTAEDETELVRDLASAGTYVELRAKLEAAATPERAALWTACNQKITRTINRILRQNLSIPAPLSIESFTLDIQDLIDYLGSEYGEPIQSAFLRHQGRVIKAVFMLMYEETAKVMTEQYMADLGLPKDGPKPNVVYLSSDMSLTYLNCLAHELEIELQPQVGAVVKRENAPILFNILKTLMEDVRARGPEFDRHLIITNEGRVMEATTGYLDEDAYVLTLTK